MYTTIWNPAYFYRSTTPPHFSYELIMERHRYIMTKRSWSDLRIELLCLVAQRLSFFDLVRFGVACKNWRQAVLDGVLGRPVNDMPWWMNYAWFEHEGKIISILELSDLVAKQTYSVGQIIREEARELFVGAKVCASKKGWLLLSKKSTGHSCIFFFYSPFCNKIIELPPLELKCGIYEHAATFTKVPTSPDGCHVYVVFGCDDSIKSCNLRNRTWSTISIRNNLCHRRIYDLVYFDGILLCNFRSSYLGAFTTELQVWGTMDLFPFLKTSLQRQAWDSPSKSYLVEESDGKLYWLVCVYWWHALQFDRSNNKWVRVKSYGEVFKKRTVFYGCPLSISTCPLVGEASDEFAGKTFYKTEIDILSERCIKFQNKSQVKWDFELLWKENLLRAAMIQLPDSIEYNK
ncbi:unnamed protein product [Malus baccata var. baccata]